MQNPPSEKLSTNPDVDSAPVVRAATGFSIFRVIRTVVILGVVAGGSYGIWTSSQTPPTLVQFTGRVVYEGKPVTTGGIATLRLDDQLDSATSALDSEGKFTLETNGEPGAYVGRHKVVISSMTQTMPPQPLIPGVYASMATTPLVIDVSTDPKKNTLEIVLEGSLPGAGSTPPRGNAIPPAAADADSDKPGNAAPQVD
jgi:hypothetical protein